MSAPGDRAVEMDRLHREEGLTLREVGERFNVSRERVRQILVAAGYPPRTKRESADLKTEITDRRIRAQLNGQPFSTASLARASGISESRVRAFLAREGIVPTVTSGGTLRWTRERIIEAIQRWTDLHGTTPTAIQWSPGLARALGREEWAEEWKVGTWPGTGAVQKHFGSFNAGIAAAGYVPRGPGDRRR